MKFTPKPYQPLAIEWLLNNPRAALWARMGMGKTVIVGTVLDWLYQSGEATGPTLVLGPKRVVANTWPADFDKWDHLKGLDIVPITGNVAQRMAAMKKDVPVFSINYENLAWLKEQHGGAWPYANYVLDEATKVKGFRTKQGAARAKILGQQVHSKHVQRVIELSGTPSPNGLKDLWGQLWMLDGGRRLGRSYAAFQDRWFQAVPGGDGYSQIRPLAFAQEQIQNAVKDICYTLDPKDWFDLREPIEIPVYVQLPPKARRAYKDMEDEMFAQIEQYGVEAFNAGARSMKCAQIANGAVYVDDKQNWTPVHDEKLDALESIIEEAAGAPVLVAYNFKHDLVRLMKRFPQGRFLDAKKSTEDDWNAGKIPVLFAHPASAGHGLNLQDGGNILVFFGHDWNLEYYLQILERIGPMRQLQSGHDRDVFIYHIITEKTTDEMMIQRRVEKRTVQDILLEAAKRRR